MSTTIDIDKMGKRYLRQSISLTAGLCLLGLLAVRIWYLDQLLVPLVISALFILAVDIADGLIWKYVAAKHPDSLATFYTSVSSFRLLLALVVLTIYYLATGRQPMLAFFLVFMVFYLVSLAHHAIFFSKVSSRL